ncbi:MAG: hypothetical protein VZR33_05770 [Methanosphaera sp.]|nr:hypothetical protein [Methanosphaera sp.]
MINIQPQTEVRLLRTPLEKEGNHTMTFSNIESQLSYFLSKTIKTYSDFTYQRETSSLVVGDSFDTINTCNYIMYRNNGFSNKYFYGYITKMEYVSENSTRIYFEIDSLQTWYFDINYKECFVEREHVNNDTVGLHTVPEEVELGEYVSEDRTLGEAVSFAYLWRRQGEGAIIRNMYVVLGVSQNADFATPGGNKMYNGVYSGLYYLIFKTFYDADNYIKYIQTQVSSDPIYTAFMVPEQFAQNVVWTDTTIGVYTFSWDYLPYTSDKITMQTAYCNKTNKLGNNYIPKNNKLLTFPYKYFIVSNNSGSATTYKYELFSGNECQFTIEGAVTVGCSIKLIPRNYQDESKNNLYSLDSGKLPTCGWTNDAYTNWLTSNAVNIGLGFAEDLIKIGSSAVTGNPMGAVSGLQGIAGSIGQIYQNSKIPLTAKGGITMGDYNFADKLTFTVHKKVIKEEYARIIDDYFSMFGYKVNSVKVPNITGRANWNYVKTIGCNFTGNIPQEDIEKIRNLFNSGITFWHNEQNFLNYSASNGII